MLRLFARLALWNVLPNGRSATFFNLWAGRRRHPERFRAGLREDLGRVLALLADGRLTAQVARTYDLTDAAAALRDAENGGAIGKIVLVPAR